MASDVTKSLSWIKTVREKVEKTDTTTPAPTTTSTQTSTPGQTDPTDEGTTVETDENTTGKKNTFNLSQQNFRHYGSHNSHDKSEEWK